MAQLMASPFSYFADSNGAPLAGGKVYTYTAGSGYATPKASYTDSTGGVSAANPVVLDSAGRAAIWLSGSYGIKVTDSLGNVISTDDPVTAGSSVTGIPWAVAAGTADAITATYNPANTQLTDGLQLAFRATAANATTTPTFSPDSLTAHTITQKGGSALNPGNIIANLAEYIVTYNLANTRWELLNPTPVAVSSVNDFRLTLTTAVPVTTGDVTGATTLYCSPYTGNDIALYDGTNWNVRQSAEFSLALGTLTSGKPYDVFCYDNAGVPTLEFLVWTDGTNRATALVRQNGVLCKTGALTRRYLGTFYTTATTTTEDSYAKRYLWNYYNRVARPMKVLTATSSWTYTTATWRQANASTTNQLNFLIGVEEDAVNATVIVNVLNAAGTTPDVAVALGLDSTTAPTAACIIGGAQLNNFAADGVPVSATYNDIIAPGVHYLAWLEISKASGTTNWLGTSGVSYTNQAGMTGYMRG